MAFIILYFGMFPLGEIIWSVFVFHGYWKTQCNVYFYNNFWNIYMFIKTFWLYFHHFCLSSLWNMREIVVFYRKVFSIYFFKKYFLGAMPFYTSRDKIISKTTSIEPKYVTEHTKEMNFPATSWLELAIG